MKLIVQSDRIAATATDEYQATGAEQVVISAPVDFDLSRLDDYRYVDGALYLAPPSISKIDFMERFTEIELAGIYTVAKTVVAVEVWLDKFRQASNVDVTDPRTVAGVQSLEAAGLIAAGRASEILI